MMTDRHAWAGLALAAALLAAFTCNEDDGGFVSSAVCPNEAPAAGGACGPEELGLACSYVAPAECMGYVVARCGPDGLWSFTSPCEGGAGSGGEAGGGGSAGSGGATGGGAGGAAGQGGSGAEAGQGGSGAAGGQAGSGGAAAGGGVGDEGGSGGGG